MPPKVVMLREMLRDFADLSIGESQEMLVIICIYSVIAVVGSRFLAERQSV